VNCVLMICDVQFVHVSKRTFLHAMRNPATSLLQVLQTYFSIFNKTSCCSTDNEKPHRWWHLPNNFGPRRKLPMLCNGPKEPPPPQISIPLFLRVRVSTYPKQHLDWFSRFITAHVTNRHTETTLRLYSVAIGPTSASAVMWQD